MRLLYALSDEKFVKPVITGRQATLLDNYQFRLHPFLRGKTPFNKDDVPIEFKVTPDTLLNLCANVIDAFPLPPVYKWTNIDVCVWIRKYGYPQYRVKLNFTEFKRNRKLHFNSLLCRILFLKI